jgi:hypothetical protein
MPERTIIRPPMTAWARKSAASTAKNARSSRCRQVSENFRKAILAREDERFYNHGAVDPIGIVRAAIQEHPGQARGRLDHHAAARFRHLPAQARRKTRRPAAPARPQVARNRHRLPPRIPLSKRTRSSKPTSTRSTGAARSRASARPPASISKNTRPNSRFPSPRCSPASSAGRIHSIPSARWKPPPASATPPSTAWSPPVITRAEADAAKLEPIEVRPKMAPRARESYAMDAIRRDLEIILEKEDIELGGLEITTTIDLRIQQKARRPSTNGSPRSSGFPATPTRPAPPGAPTARERAQGAQYIQGAAVVIENRTGAVLAVVGGRDANESRFNRAKDAAARSARSSNPSSISPPSTRACGRTPRSATARSNPARSRAAAPGGIRKTPTASSAASSPPPTASSAPATRCPCASATTPAFPGRRRSPPWPDSPPDAGTPPRFSAPGRPRRGRSPAPTPSSPTEARATARI